MSDIVERLREKIITDAFTQGEITSGALAERLIRERLDAADEIDRLQEENDGLLSTWAEIKALRDALRAENERLRENLEWLRATFRLNMIRAYPNIPHEEIDEKIKFVEEYPNRTSLGESDD